MWETCTKPTKVSVNEDDDVDDFVKAALIEMRLNDIAPNLVQICGHEKADIETPIKDLIKGNTYENPLILYEEEERQELEAVKYSPPIFPLTIAEFVLWENRDLQKRINYISPCYHWFALEAYRAFHIDIQLTDDIIHVTLNEISSEVKENVLSSTTDQFLAIMKQSFSADTVYLKRSTADGDVDEKATYTAQLAVLFNNFLFSDDFDNAACYHQLPIRFKPTGVVEAADLYVLSKKDGLPDTPLLVSAMSMSSYYDAYMETAAYALTCFDDTNLKMVRCVILGLAMTCEEIGLFVFVGHEQKMFMMEVANTSTCTTYRSGTNDIMKFFAALYGCIHSLRLNPIMSTTSSLFTLKCDGSHYSLTEHGMVFHCRTYNLIHKFYDSKLHRSASHSNFPLIDILKLLPNAKYTRYDSRDNRIELLEYDFINGSHFATSCQQLVNVIKVLDSIHSLGYVHSDIRKENIVFCVDSDQAYIIDFDLIGRDGESYPRGYNHYGIPERHSSARESKERKKEHDRYSLYKVFSSYPFANQEVLKQLNDSEIPLSTIANKLVGTGD